MKRLFDIILSAILLIIFLVPFVVISLWIKISSKGPIIFWSNRVGYKNKIFKMPKFRTMYVETPLVATHLLNNYDKFITPFGSFLRKSSLDETPQLVSIFIGDMSFVGPRPALFNQYDLIEQRTLKGIHELMPGLTGWAQINGRDELTNPGKVYYDEEYMIKQSFTFDLKILYFTFIKVLKRTSIKH